MGSVNTHYFANHALGWAVGDTREEAVENLANQHHYFSMGKWLRNVHKAGEPGIYIWSCKVNAAKDAPYKIEWFMPVGVDIEDGREHFVTYSTAKKVAVWNKPKVETMASLAADKKAAAA
jgi:hypothetical protein